jgi:hypothetical protein
MDIIKDLTEQVSNWALLGHPALLDRFILRNGKLYTPTKRIGPKRKPKECFGNATKYVLSHSKATYVEGYVMGSKLPIPIHHAWVTMTGTDAMDPTLDAENYQYLGIAFDTATVERELARYGVYGVLDPGLGLNHRKMFEVDPELEAVCKAVKMDRLMQQAKEKTT